MSSRGKRPRLTFFVALCFFCFMPVVGSFVSTFQSECLVFACFLSDWGQLLLFVFKKNSFPIPNLCVFCIRHLWLPELKIKVQQLRFEVKWSSSAAVYKPQKQLSAHFLQVNAGYYIDSQLHTHTHTHFHRGCIPCFICSPLFRTLHFTPVSLEQIRTRLLLHCLCFLCPQKSLNSISSLWKSQ